MQAEPVCDPLYETGCELAVEFDPVIAELLVLSLCLWLWVLSLQVDEVVQFEGRVVRAESAHDGERRRGRWLAGIRHADELHLPSPYAFGRGREASTRSSWDSRCFRVSCHLPLFSLSACRACRARPRRQDMAQDYSRAITASLFSGNPRQSPPPLAHPCVSLPHLLTHTHTRAAQQSLISYVKTFEEQPGSSQLKARFLILAGTSPSSSPRGTSLTLSHLQPKEMARARSTRRNRTRTAHSPSGKPGNSTTCKESRSEK